MNRILRRPMFRMGGSTSGITSGLDAPRQNYQNAGSVNQFEMNRLMANAEKLKPAAMSVFLEGAKNRGQFDTGKNVNMMQSAGDTAVGGTSLEDAIAMARAKSEEIAGDNRLTGRQELSRFLIPFGLNLATARPMGDGLSGLFATAAGAAKGPASQLFKTRDEREKTQAEKEADLFNTFLSAGLEDRRFDRKQAAEK